jgi:hypothetical protein
MDRDSEWQRYQVRLRPVRFHVVDPARHPEVLIRHLGSRFGPGYIEKVADSLAWLSVRGSWSNWQMYEVEHGGCFAAPGDVEEVRLHRPDRHFDESLGAVAAGLCATMLATNRLLHEIAGRYERVPLLERQARQLSRLAVRQPDARAIRRILD